MKLRQTFSQAIDSPLEWEGGAKQVFDWTIEWYTQGNGKVHIGSWEANRWYDIAVGKTERQTLANLKRKLAPMMQKRGLVCTFEYIEDEEY